MPLTMMTMSQQFRDRVEAFLRESGFKASELGKQSVGDPTFVTGLRRGRSPTLATVDKVLAFIRQVEAGGTIRSEARRSR